MREMCFTKLQGVWECNRNDEQKTERMIFPKELLVSEKMTLIKNVIFIETALQGHHACKEVLILCRHEHRKQN